MKLTKLLLMCSAILFSTSVMAQQQDTDNDGVCNPDASHPAFGTYVDYAKYPQKTNLPTMYITVYKTTYDSATGATTYDDTQTMDISTTKTDWYYQCRITIVDQNGKMKQRDELVQLRGRGNSTWTWVNSGKRPFRLKFPSKTKLLADYDMATGQEVNEYANEKNWTLLANAFDKSLIHNALTYEIGHNKLTNLAFCPSYRFVDLVVNGVNYGTYQVSDHVQVASDRVNVDSSSGWFMEFTGGTGSDYLEEPYFVVNSNLYTNIKAPETSADDYAAQKEYITNVYTQIIQANQYSETTTSDFYSSLIDKNSLIDWIIGEEIAGNYDGTKGNMYNYMNATDDKLHFGPMWDLDIAYGAYGSMAEKHIWGDTDHGYMGSTLLCKVLYNNASFFKAFYERWQTIYNKGELKTFISGKIDDLAKQLTNGDYSSTTSSQYLNFNEATPFGISPTSVSTADNMGGSYTSYQAAVEATRSFMTSHIDWLNNEYAAQYTALGCDDLDDGGNPAVGLTDLGENYKGWSEHSYKYQGSSSTMVEGATLTITLEGTSPYFSAFAENQYTAWISTYSGAPLVYTKTLTADDVTSLKNNGYAFLICVYNSGTCASVTLEGGNVVEDCSTTGNHTWGTEYVRNDDGRYSYACTVCGTYKDDKVYKFTVYPESATAETVYAASWAPDTEKPNSIAIISVTKGLEPTGNNIVNTSAGTCANLVLTDGHPVYVHSKFTATTATYTRTLGTSNWGTICLPYKVQTVDDTDATFYALTAASGSTLSFDVATKSGAYTPLAFKRKNKATTLTVTSTDVTVKASTETKTSSTVTGWTLNGVMEATSAVSSGTQGVFYFSQDKFFKAVKDVTVNPFRAYFTTDGTAVTPAKAMNIVISGDIDGIMEVENDKSAAGNTVRYNLAGQRLSQPLKGINVINGKKYVVK